MSVFKPSVLLQGIPISNGDFRGTLPLLTVLGRPTGNISILRTVVELGSSVSTLEPRLLFALAGIALPDAETIKAFVTRAEPLPSSVQQLIAWLDDKPMRTLQLQAAEQLNFELFERTRSKHGRCLPLGMVQLAELCRMDIQHASLCYVLSIRHPVHIISEDAKFMLFALCWQSADATKPLSLLSCKEIEVLPRRKSTCRACKPWIASDDCMATYRAIIDYTTRVHQTYMVMAHETRYAGIKTRKQILAECLGELPKVSSKLRKFLSCVLALRLVRSATESIPKYMRFAPLGE